MGLVSSSLHQPGFEQAFSMKVAEVVPSLIPPVTCLLAPRDLPSNCALALLQRKAGGPQTGQPGSTNTHLDVHSLAWLQSSNVPATDDSPKYSYRLGQHGQYGECLPHPHSKLYWSPPHDCFCYLTPCMHSAYSVFQTCPPCCHIFSLPLYLIPNWVQTVGTSLGRLCAGSKAELWLGTAGCRGETGTVDLT